MNDWNKYPKIKPYLRVKYWVRHTPPIEYKLSENQTEVSLAEWNGDHFEYPLMRITIVLEWRER